MQPAAGNAAQCRWDSRALLACRQRQRGPSIADKGLRGEESGKRRQHLWRKREEGLKSKEFWKEIKNKAYFEISRRCHSHLSPLITYHSN